MYGEVAEWLKAAVSKTVMGATPSRVRISPSPPPKDSDIDTMSESSFLPEKSLFAGLFRLFLFWIHFKVETDLVHFRFKMGIFACTLK